MEDVPSTSTASSTLRHTPDLAVAGDGHTSTRSQTVSLDKLNGVKNGSISGNTVLGQLFGNPFFTAGFGLAGLGAALAVSKQALKRSAELLRKRILVDVEITRNDESYQWLLLWMAAYHRQQMAGLTNGLERGASSVDRQHASRGLLSNIHRRIMPRMHHLQMQTTRLNTPDGSSHTRFSLVPGPGTHIIRFRKTFIWMTRQREKSFDLQTGTPFETIVLTTLYAHRHIFQSLFLEAHEQAQQMHEGKTIVYTSWGAEWRQFGQPKRKRPLDSVVLAKGLKEHILDDIGSFLHARTWYLDRGIPYRRGYLLYGPPGTGKSSFIQALAGHLDFNIALLNLSERGLTDDRLNHLMSNVPPRTVVLLEDADAAFSNRTQSDEHGYNGATVTFSGLLNALDGVASAEERIVFLTTNHVDRLDEALIRPGRVDLAVKLVEASEWQVRQLWDRFYEEEDSQKGQSSEQENRSRHKCSTETSEERAFASRNDCNTAKEDFVSEMKRLGLIDRISTAALQGLFLMNKEDPVGATALLKDLKGQVDRTK